MLLILACGRITVTRDQRPTTTLCLKVLSLSANIKYNRFELLTKTSDWWLAEDGALKGFMSNNLNVVLQNNYLLKCYRSKQCV